MHICSIVKTITPRCRGRPDAGIIFGGDSERFAHFYAKNLIEIGLMGEKSHRKM